MRGIEVDDAYFHACSRGDDILCYQLRLSLSIGRTIHDGGTQIGGKVRFRICTVDPPRLAFARLATDEYLKRLRAYGGAELRSVRSGTASEEAERLLRASEGYLRIVLDERGSSLSTAVWRTQFDMWERAGARKIAFLIGGAEGHGEAIRAAGIERWSLSDLTLQHELALVVLLEQIYRVQSWRRGEPYHREGARA